MTLVNRTKTINDFRSADGPHVLLISQVGNTGLNLDFANVMIVIVRDFKAYFFFSDQVRRILSGQHRSMINSLGASIDILRRSVF